MKACKDKKLSSLWEIMEKRFICKWNGSNVKNVFWKRKKENMVILLL